MSTEPVGQEPTDPYELARWLTRKYGPDWRLDDELIGVVELRHPWLGMLDRLLKRSLQADWDVVYGDQPFDAMNVLRDAPESARTRLARETYDAGLRLVLLSEDPLPPGGAEDPVGTKEIADRLRVEQQTAWNWKQRGVFPPARWTVGGRDAWSWPIDIEPWARQTGRLLS